MSNCEREALDVNNAPADEEGTRLKLELRVKLNFLDCVAEADLNTLAEVLKE